MKKNNLPLFTAEQTLNNTNGNLFTPFHTEAVKNKYFEQNFICENTILPQKRLRFELTKDDPRGAGGGSDIPPGWEPENQDLPDPHTPPDMSANENYPTLHTTDPAVGEQGFFPLPSSALCRTACYSVTFAGRVACLFAKRLTPLGKLVCNEIVGGAYQQCLSAC